MSKTSNALAKGCQIAVSGSNGLIGSALCRQLLQRGYHVRPIVRRQSSSGPDSRATSDREIEWDPIRGLVDPIQLNSVDCVVHLAGRGIATRRWTTAEKRRIRESRVSATRRMVDQLVQLESPPMAFVSASAIGIYGDQADRIVDEQTLPANEYLADVAHDWEQACQPLVEIGIRVVHPRFGMVLAREGGALQKVIPLFRWYMGGRLGSGEQYWSWIGLDDCIRVLLWMIETKSASGAYNAVAPQPVTNREFTTSMAQALCVPALVSVPGWALKLALGEMANELLLCSCRAIPRRLGEAGFEFEQPNLKQFFRQELQGN